MGYVSTIAAGSDLFTYQFSTTADNNESFSAVIFAPPGSPPSIAVQPQDEVVFTNVTVQFSVLASGGFPLYYQWFTNSTMSALSDAGNLTGSTSNVLTILNATFANAGDYTVIATNLYGSATSSVANLSLVLPCAYEAAVLTNDPFAFYTFSETADPEIGNVVAYDSMGAFNGTYGTGGVNDQNGSGAENGADGIAGPRATADGMVGFPDTNTALGCIGGNFPVDSYVSAPAFNLNNGVGTNVLTITAWINPAGPQAHGVGIVFSRSGTTTAGLDYNATNIDGNLELGYNWNNDANTYGWDSALEATPGIWSLVALVITPTNATIYVLNANGLQFSVNSYTNPPQKFEGPTLIGNDISDASGGRNFNGSIDEVAFFSQALTVSNISALYAAGSGIVLSPQPPTISIEPSWPSPVYAGQSASATVTGTGGTSYQWLAGLSGVYTNLTDGTNISGSTTPTLTIKSVQSSNALDYIVVITNFFGSITSAPPATLTVSPPGPAINFTLNYGGSPIVQGSGSDWNTVNNWNPGGLSATASLLANPGSTFEAVTGSRLRTPATNSTFPVQLTLDGSGIYENDTANPTNVSELRFKNSSAVPTNIFNSLVLNGGQLDAGVNGTEIIQGNMTVAANSTIYVDTSAGNDRGYRIDSQLSGSGNLFWHQYGGTLGGIDLEITGTSNTFSGQWIVDQGALVGVGVNSLGTNNIIVGTNGLTAAVETLYDINDTNASLILGANGEMFLHQTDSFASVTVNGTSLANGTYTFATLNGTYPGNFPATWTQQAGSTFTTGSGEIVVGSVVVGPPSSPQITSIGLSGTSLSISATNGTAGGSWELLQSTNVALPLTQWQTNLTGNFDGSGNLSTNIVNTATNLQEFYILKVQ